MPWLLANDFGGLQSAENAADSNRRQALASAMGAATSGLQFATNQKRLQEQLDEKKKQDEEDLAMKAQELELKMGNQAMEQERFRGQQKTGEDYLQFYKDQAANAPNAVKNREHDLMWSRAVSSADQGSFESPEHIKRLFPDFSPAEAQVLADHSQQARQSIESNYDFAARAADTLNKHLDLTTRVIPAAKEYIKQNSYKLLPDSDEVKAKRKQLEDATKASETIGPIATRIQNDKKLGELISFDPSSEAYVPSAPAPKWRNGAPAASAEAPLGWTPTSGGRTFKPVLPNAASVGAVPAQVATPGYSPRYDPWVYKRASDLVSTGLDKISASRQALAEYQQASAAGSIP